MQNCGSPEKFFMTDRRATVPPIVKTEYLLRRKRCARFGLNFSIFLLCQVKIPDEKNTKHDYLLGKNTNKPLVHFDKPLSSWKFPARIYRLNLPPFWAPSSIRISTISFSLEINWITSQLLFFMRENNLRVKQKCVTLFNKTIPEFDTLLLWKQWAKLSSYKPVW